MNHPVYLNKMLGVLLAAIMLCCAVSCLAEDNGKQINAILGDAEIVEETSAVIHYQSPQVEYQAGVENEVTVRHPFFRGQKVYFRVEDELPFYDYGHFASYYEGEKLIAENRKGSNGWFEHIVTADCDALSVRVSDTEYEPGVALRLHVYEVHGEIVPHIITVGQDGTKMFTSLKDAVESITDANSYVNPYVIQIYPGVYNTLADFSDDQIASAEGQTYTNESFVGLKITDGISLLGMGATRDEVVLTAALSSRTWPYNVRRNISTLNVQGSCAIENMTILGSNLRYCIHDDFRVPTNTHGWRRLKNLKLAGSTMASSPHSTTYGAGMSQPRDYEIIDCDFGFGLSIHGNGRYKFGCTIRLENCTGSSFGFTDMATSENDAKVRIVVNNCDIERIALNQSDPSISCHATLEGVGCENSMICCRDDQIWQLGMIFRTLPGFEKGTLLCHVEGGKNFKPTSDITLASGVVVGADENYTYVQHTGYLPANVLGLEGLTIGDYVTVDENARLVPGGSAERCVGIVAAVDENSRAHIRLLFTDRTDGQPDAPLDETGSLAKAE